MEWYNILAIVVGAFGGTAGLISLYKAKPERTSIEVKNMTEMLDEAHKMFNTMKEEKEAEHKEFEEYKKNNMAYVAEFKERFQKVEDRLDKAEQFVFTLKSAIYRGYRCPYPPSVEDCPIIKAYKGEGCEDCEALSEK
jgi:site-specific DNA-adenine methylase